MLVDWNINGERRPLRSVAKEGGVSVNQSVRRKGPREITLVGTLERDPQFYPNRSGNGEHATVRVHAVTPGYTFTRDGREMIVKDKPQWLSATVVGAGVEKLRTFRAGDEIALRNATVEPYKDEAKRAVIGIRAFDVSSEVPDGLRKAPNQVHLAGTVAEVSFRANKGNQQLDYMEYKVVPFGKDAEPVLVREYGASTRELEAARAKGEKLELDGRLVHSSFAGRNGRIDTYYISTTTKEVENMRERAAERSQERDRERVGEIDREIASLTAEHEALLSEDRTPGAPAYERIEAIAQQETMLLQEREWLAKTPAERAAMYERQAAEREASAPERAEVPQSELDAVAALNEEHREEERIDLGALPVVSPASTLRDATEIPHDFNARVRGRDESGERVIATLGGKLVSIDRSAFSERPEVGEVVEVSRDGAGVRAMTERQAELAAEQEIARGEEIEVG